MRPLLCAVALLALTGCEEWRENAGSATGPTIEVHCDAVVPSGSTTTKVDCP